MAKRTAHKVVPSRESTGTKSPRVIFDEQGIARVTGVHQEHLRAILTGAYLNANDGLRKARSKIQEKGTAAKLDAADRQNITYWTEQLAILDALKNSADICIAATHDRPGPQFNQWADDKHAKSDARLAKDLAEEPWA